MTSPIKKIPFYFIRHGQTDWNKENKRMGQTDIPLNQQGIKEAHAAGKLLAGAPITQIVTSPLQRAHQTAVIIGTYLNVPVIVHKDLQEIHLGIIQGTTISAAGLKAGIAPEGSEDLALFVQRIVNALNSILHEDHQTLIVSHAGVHWQLMNLLGHHSVDKAANCQAFILHPPTATISSWHYTSLIPDKD